MMPDYSTWKITLEQYVTDFERENLEHDPGLGPSHAVVSGSGAEKAIDPPLMAATTLSPSAIAPLSRSRERGSTR